MEPFEERITRFLGYYSLADIICLHTNLGIMKRWARIQAGRVWAFYTHGLFSRHMAASKPFQCEPSMPLEATGVKIAYVEDGQITYNIF